MTAKAVGDLL